MEDKEIQKFWEENEIYKTNLKGNKFYSVDTPPPTISGKMHIGHACSYTQEDAIVRFEKMKGKNIIFPFGTDDNGLPTERFIEKEKGVKSTKMKSEDFIELCEKTIEDDRALAAAEEEKRRQAELAASQTSFDKKEFDYDLLWKVFVGFIFILAFFIYKQINMEILHHIFAY